MAYSAENNAALPTIGRNSGCSNQVDCDVLLGATAEVGQDTVRQQPDHGNRRQGNDGLKFKNKSQRSGQQR